MGAKAAGYASAFPPYIAADFHLQGPWWAGGELAMM
jgi:hypothetical protein